MTEMVLVPTPEMVKAGRDAAQSAVAHFVPWNEVATSVYAAMIAASPSSPVGEGVREKVARAIALSLSMAKSGRTVDPEYVTDALLALLSPGDAGAQQTQETP